MSTILGETSAMFWNPNIWLPPNITWQNFSEETVLNDRVILPEDYAQFSDLCYPIPMAFMLLLIRWVLERLLFRPLGQKLGLKDRRDHLTGENSVLENIFRKTISVAQISRDTGLSCIQVNKASCMCNSTIILCKVERWLRRRRLAGTPSKLDKFCETGWRWLFYSAIFLYGLTCLLDKPWLWDVRHCWYDYPYHTVIIVLRGVRIIVVSKSRLTKISGCTICWSWPSTGLCPFHSSLMSREKISGKCSSTT